MGNGLWIHLLPFIIVIMSFLILIGLIKLYKRSGNKWEFQALYMIPVTFMALYGWITVLEPSIQAARTWVRLTITFDMGGVLYIIFSILKSKWRGK